MSTAEQLLESDPLPVRKRKEAERISQSADRPLPPAVEAEGDVTYLQAISQGLFEELERDENAFIMGEDVGVYGGAFKVTQGFLDYFGPWRVIDTPISEAALTGMTVGAALSGMVPIVEYQYMDFMSGGWDVMVNLVAKYRSRTGRGVGATFRGPSGGGVGAGPFHSQSPEGWWAAIPGLKVVCPATPEDAKGLTKAAIRDPDPVIVFEHKALYRRLKGPMPEGDHVVPLGEARVAREGDDVTIVTYGARLHTALEAAQRLEDEDGASVEVVDLRTLMPWDRDTVLASVSRTSRVVVVSEATHTYGPGAEVAATIADVAFWDLDAPVLRVAAKDAPPPFAPGLEEAWLPQVDDVVEAVRRTNRI